MQGGDLIGVGAQGCLYAPMLQKDGKHKDDSKVGKLMMLEDAQKEMQKVKLFVAIDPKQERGVYGTLNVMTIRNQEEFSAVVASAGGADEVFKCKDNAETGASAAWSQQRAPFQIAQIVMPKANSDLGNMIATIPADTDYLPFVLSGCLNLVRGLALYHKHDLVHADIKLGNVAAFPIEGGDVTFKFIDWGMSGTSATAFSHGIGPYIVNPYAAAMYSSGLLLSDSSSIRPCLMDTFVKVIEGYETFYNGVQMPRWLKDKSWLLTVGDIANYTVDYYVPKPKPSFLNKLLGKKEEQAVDKTAHLQAVKKLTDVYALVCGVIAPMFSAVTHLYFDNKVPLAELELSLWNPPPNLVHYDDDIGKKSFDDVYIREVANSLAALCWRASYLGLSADELLQGFESGFIQSYLKGGRQQLGGGAAVKRIYKAKPKKGSPSRKIKKGSASRKLHKKKSIRRNK